VCVPSAWIAVLRAFGCAGGSDTGVAALNTFIMMMVSNPEVQAKAQAELDTILGKNVLPTFEDEASLPYITAIVKETLRCGSDF